MKILSIYLFFLKDIGSLRLEKIQVSILGYNGSGVLFKQTKVGELVGASLEYCLLIDRPSLLRIPSLSLDVSPKITCEK